MKHVTLAWLMISLMSIYLKSTLSDEVLPERAEVCEVNKKYLSGVKVFIRRTSRKSPYYINFEGTTLEWVGNNVSIHAVFYEFLHNEYKRSFVELDMNMCELISKEPWYSLYGKSLQERGLKCPLPPNFYQFHNLTVSLKNFPYRWPFEKVMIRVELKLMPTREMIAQGRIYATIKQDIPKGK